MKKVGVAELKARLSEHLRAVRRGQTVIVLDRDTPIARITPIESKESPLVIRPRSQRAVALREVPLPTPLKLKTDLNLLLAQERGER